MARKSDEFVRNSAADDLASAVEKTTKPVLRKTIAGLNDASGSVIPASPQPPSQPSSQPLEPRNDPSTIRTNNNAKARQITIKNILESLLNSTINMPQYDCFGPLVYSSGEPFRLYSSLSLLALLFGTFGISYMVFSSLTVVVMIQFIKMTLTIKDIPQQTMKGAPQFIDNSICKALYYSYGLLTAILVLVQLNFMFLNEVNVWIYYGIFGILFLQLQVYYWPIHGYLLHKQIIGSRRQVRQGMSQGLQDAWKGTASYVPRYVLLFAGSGGHTAELLRMMRLYEPFDDTSIRRWVVTKGDQRSVDDIQTFERERTVKRSGRVSGAFEILEVARARYVRQSWFTTPFTAFYCVIDCYRVLMTTRPWNIGAGDSQVEFPQTIFCDGPGSVAILVLLSHLLRMYGVIPANRCEVLYVESVARVKTLSLTGKIFYYLSLPDLFITQHKEVANAFPGITAEESLTSRAPIENVMDFGPNVFNAINNE